VGRKGFTRDKLIYLMQSTANKKALEENGSYATRLGAGLIDAYAALKAETSGSAPNPVKDLKGTANANSITLTWSVPAAVEGETPYAYDIFYSKGSLASLDPANPGSGVEKIRVFGAGKPAGTKLTETLSGLDFGTAYHFRICSENLLGTFSALSAEQTVPTVSNSKPEITPLDGTSLTLAAYENGSMRFRLSDADGHALSYEGDALPGLTYKLDADVLTLSIDALRADDGKTYQGSFTVTDGYDETKQEFSYTIKANGAPVVSASIEDQIYTSTSESRTFDLSMYFSDPDKETLSYQAEQSTTNLIVKTEVADGVLTLTGNSYGQTTVKVTASDARGESASLEFRVLVRDASRAVDLYPNPVKDYLYIRAGETKTVDVIVSNKAGAVVFSQENATLDPFQPISVDLRSQPGGTYYVRIGDERHTIVKQ
jgi:hypothetical protein